jgi:hypothetical protein
MERFSSWYGYTDKPAKPPSYVSGLFLFGVVSGAERSNFNTPVTVYKFFCHFKDANVASMSLNRGFFVSPSVRARADLRPRLRILARDTRAYTPTPPRFAEVSRR